MRLYLLSTLAAVLASQSLPGQSAIPLTAFSQSLEALAARVEPAVVQIVSTGYGRGDESQNGSASLLTRQRSTGSGVILTADGYIVTNNHVVQGARKIEVRLAAGPENSREAVVQAKLVGMDRQTDLAVIKIERGGLPLLTFGDLKDVRVGQVVM